MIASLNHVAVLVEGVETVLARGFFDPSIIGEIEGFPSEGTLECYIGPHDCSGRLLLLQPNGDGPYQRAMKKRGPGLHHLAIDVIDIEAFVRGLSGSGWYLHPVSLDYYKTCRQVYLARPGIGALIEVQERPEETGGECFIQEVRVSLDRPDLIESLCCDRISAGAANSIRLAGGIVGIDDLIMI